MRRGLVIGKFMPIHNGHIALINFAASQCDELIVSMSYTRRDPINPDLRFAWIKEIFKDRITIHPEISEDNFDDEQLPLPERTRIWAEFIKGRFPKVDVLFSSEEYGVPFADHLGIPHVSFDPPRTQVPVSATMIRQHPYQNWEYIPVVVQPYFVKKVCLYGPESTGKSTMAKKLAERYHTTFVPEVARELILSNEFSIDDIIKIGRAQHHRVEEMLKGANKLLFCDTDAITTQIYSRHYLHTVPEVLFELEAKWRYDQYFLFDIDVPWVKDDMRDLGHRRQEMYDTFKGELDVRRMPYIKVNGSWQEREHIITNVIDQWLSPVL
jgi:HTH-type transcriptional repressor of NAD biosynthesis genes